MTAKQDMIGTNNDQLASLLHEWRAIDPAPGFEEAVRQRIGSETAPGRETDYGGGVALKLLGYPLWAKAAAAALIAGAAAGLLLQPVSRARRADHPLLNSRTMAGAYLAMAIGDER